MNSSQQTVRVLAKFLINAINFHALYSILLQRTNSPRVGLDSHFSGESVSFRDYTLPVKIDMSAPVCSYVVYPSYTTMLWDSKWSR